MKYIASVALCLMAGFLASCIKEESYVAKDVVLAVNLSRAGVTSSQQGDKIEDIMIWAFDLSNGYELAGWRRYTPSTDTFTSLSLHIPVKTCGAGGSVYRLVAVLNTPTFTDKSGQRIELGPQTTYSELINARFVSEDLMESPIDETLSLAMPAVMPVAHWGEVVVNRSNLHADDNCANAPLTVFRTVAKTQFSIARKSDFALTVKSLTLHSNSMPEEGMILSSSLPEQLMLTSAEPEWFSANEPKASAAGAIELLSEPLAITSAASVPELIGARFIYESRGKCDYSANAKQTPQGDGYYYKIVYEVAGAEHTRYVGIPSAVVRNHDYRVDATVTAEGQIEATYTVAEWEDVKWEIKFDVPQHSLLMTAPSDDAAAPAQSPTLYYSGVNDLQGAFVAYFKMDGPVGASWKPTFVGGADDYAVEVYSKYGADGKLLTSGDYTRRVDGFIAPQQDTFFKIVVRALKADNIGGKVKLGIIYTPVWNPTANPLVIINKGSEHNGLYYPYADWDAGAVDDEPDMFWVTIKQVEQPNL